MLTTKAGEILGNNAIHLSGLDIFHHALECWAIKVRTTPTVINVLVNYNEVLLISKLCDDFALRWNLSRGFSAKHNVSENSVQNICRAVSPQRKRIIGSMVFFYL